MGQDGVMAPCVLVSLLIDGCGAVIEDVMDCTRSSVAEGAARVGLNLPSAEVDWRWETINSRSDHKRHLTC